MAGAEACRAQVSGPRSLQPSQWGMVCPADTPEGESCGLDKNLALTAFVTQDADPLPVQLLAFALGVQPLAVLAASQLHAKCGTALRAAAAAWPLMLAAH